MALESPKNLNKLLALALLLFIVMAPGQILAASSTKPWKLVSWASPVGSNALHYETLNGFKSMLAFLNANGGLADRQLELFALDMDDGNSDFASKLTTLVEQGQPDLAVGGAISQRPKETADFFRRINRPWFGPWSNQAVLYQGSDDDPIGLLPTDDLEISLLVQEVRRSLGANSLITMILFRGPQSKDLILLAEEAAKKNDVLLQTKLLNTNFRSWFDLQEDLATSQAVILWLPPGPTAAIVRELAPKMAKTTLWMTSSTNAPSRELIHMTGGAWEGMIFPSILSPKDEIPKAYESVLLKYGPPGMSLGYRNYLGFAQGMLLARVLTEAGKEPSNHQNLTSIFKKTTGEATLLPFVNFTNGKPDEQSFYLATTTRNGDWQPVP